MAGNSKLTNSVVPHFDKNTVMQRILFICVFGLPDCTDLKPRALGTGGVAAVLDRMMHERGEVAPKIWATMLSRSCRNKGNARIRFIF